MRLITHCFLFCFIFSFATTVYGSKPFEDFSSSQFDLAKWTVGERAVKIEGGKLLMKRQTRSWDGQNQGVNLHLMGGVPDRIGAKITVDGQLDNPIYVMDHIAGGLTAVLYAAVDERDDTAPDREVLARIHVFCKPPLTNASSCYAYYGINYADDWTEVGGAAFPQNFAVGSEVTIGITYDEGNNKFIFSLDNETAELPCPPKKSSVVNGGVTLNSYVYSEDPPDGSSIASGTVMVFFDDVVASGGNLAAPINDTFSTPWINPLYWANFDTGNENFWGSRIFKEGQLELSLQNDGLSGTQTVVPIQVEHQTDFLQADITVDSGSLVTGNTINDQFQIRLEGWYWNDTYINPVPGDDTGLYGTHIRIEKQQSTGNLRAVGLVYRCLDAACSNAPVPFREVLDCDVQYNIPITLAIERRDRHFTFTCNKASKTYDYPTSLQMYPSPTYQQIRRIRARAYTSDRDNKSYLKAYVDNVYTVKKRSSLLLSLIPILAAQHHIK